MTFDEVLKKCDEKDEYLRICQRIRDDKNYSPPDLNHIWDALRSQPNRYLRRDDLDEILSDKTPHGYYWKVPMAVKVEGKKICLNERRQGQDIKQWRRDTVKKAFAVLKSMEVTSVVLAGVHPKDFGIYSPPILTFLQVPISPKENPSQALRGPVGHFLTYCDELRAWGQKFLQTDDVLRADRALWVFYESAYGHNTIQHKMAGYRKCFEEDEWVRRRRAQNVLGPYFSDYKPTDQARHLLDIDANVSAKIAGCEFEARIMELVDPDRKERKRKIRSFILTHPALRLRGEERLRAAVEYVIATQACDVPADELHRARTFRNKSIHMLLGLSRGNVEEIIATTEKIPKRK